MMLSPLEKTVVTLYVGGLIILGLIVWGIVELIKWIF